MRFDVLSIFPEMFESYLAQSLLNKAIQRGLVETKLWNIRDFTEDKHQKIDDRPFGGGPGMLLCCQPVFDCVEEVQQDASEPGQLVMLTPQGRKLDHQFVTELAEHKRLLLLCGRYEGFDERIRTGLNPLEISVGDFIANGGEVPAMLIIDTVIRMIPGVLGDETSHKYDSFAQAGLLEHPQYTRPREFRGMTVPDILLGGHHEKIALWQHEQSLKRTEQRRADLLDNGNSSRPSENN